MLLLSRKQPPDGAIFLERIVVCVRACVRARVCVRPFTALSCQNRLMIDILIKDVTFFSHTYFGFYVGHVNGIIRQFI